MDGSKSHPNTDNGTDMQLAAKYRQDKGIRNATGSRHKIGAYVALRKGNIQEHLIGLYLFGSIGVGLSFPNSAMEQFENGEPWSVVDGAEIDGGHYVSLVAKRGDYLYCVTWGKVQKITVSFFKKFNDESILYLSEEMLANGKTDEGFDYQQLLSDLKTLKE